MNPTTPHNAGDASLELRVLRDKLKLVLNQLPRAVASNILTALLFAVLAYRTVPTGALAVWILVLVVFNVARLASRNSLQLYCDTADSLQGLHHPERWLSAQIFVSALLWSSIVTLLLPSGATGYQALAGFFLACIAAGAVVSYAIRPRLALICPFTLFIPFAARLMLEGTAIHFGIAGVALLYLTMLVLLSRELGAYIDNALELRFRNERLLDQLKQAHESAVSAVRAKTQFLANMSHEIRTPLNGVVGMTDVALEYTTDPRIRYQLGVIRQCGASMMAIVTDVFQAAEIHTEKLTLDPQPFSPRALVESTVQLFSSKAKAKGISLTASAGAGIPELVVGDVGCVSRILFKLASNAVRYTSQGDVRLTVERGDSGKDANAPVRLIFRVIDTGPGIAEATRAKLFDPPSSPGKPEGGLATCKRLLSALGGEIALASEPGRGTVFSFHVPFDRASVRFGSDAAAPTVAASEKAGARILVVEDNPVNQMLAELQLTKAGFEVASAGDGQQALDRLSTESFDLVLMDCQMPVMDGFQATREIRNREKASGLPARLPIVAMTANALAEDRQACLDAGMDDYVTKPVKAEVLMKTVERWLAAPAVDPAALREIARFDDGTGAVLAQVVGQFLETTGKMLPELVAAQAAGDAATVTRHAHSLKSSAALVGAKKLSTLAKEAEKLAKEGQCAGAGPTVKAIEAEYARVRTELSALTQAPAGKAA